MLVAGIDVGGKNVHVVIAEDGKLLVKKSAPSGINKISKTEDLYEKTLHELRLQREDISRVVTTGSFGRQITFAGDYIPDADADARGVIDCVPSARTIIDVGAEEGRAIKISPEGMVLDFSVNEKCAAGSGTFIDTMARALELTLADMAEISLESENSVSINAQCAVFGESEVVSLIHQNVAKKDIAAAVHAAIAGKIGSQVRIIGMEPGVVLVGGLGLNGGFIKALNRALNTTVIVPDDPDYIGAVGAAVAARSERTAL